MAIKAEDLGKELAQFLDIDLEKHESIDTVKNYFNETFAKKAVYKNELLKDPEIGKHIAGKRLGAVENKTRQLAKELGIEFAENELNDKLTEDIIELVGTKIKEKHKSELDVLKKSTDNPNEALKALEEQLAKERKEKGKYKNDFENLGKDFETYKQDQSKRERENKIRFGKSKAYEAVKFKPEATEFEILGFKTKIENDYKFELTEDEKFVVLDKDGNPIQNPNKAGTYYEPEEFLKAKAIESKLFQLNKDGGQSQQRVINTPVHQLNNIDEPAKLINPRALGR